MTIIDDTTTRPDPTSLEVRPPEAFLYGGKGEIPAGWELSREANPSDVLTPAERESAVQVAFDPKRHMVVRGLTPDHELTPGTSTRDAMKDAGFDCIDVPDSQECYFVRDRTAPENTRSAPGRSAGAGLGR